MIPAMFKVDIFKEMEKFHEQYGKIHIVTLSSCINELEKLKQKGNRHAILGIKLTKKINVINSNDKSADKAIIKYAKELKNKNNIDVAVATSDRKLIKTLNRNKIKIIRLRQKKYLVIE